MSYQELFNRYGSRSREADIRINGYLVLPDKLNTAKDITWEDGMAARLIADCEKLIAQMKEYRQDLAKRYNQLETMAYSERVELERNPRLYSGVSYYVRIVRKYQDGTEITVQEEHFPGKERHQAIKRFEEIKKQRPGIEAAKDIEKRSWER